MNLLKTRAFDHPEFTRLVIYPVFPFIIGAVVIITSALLSYNKAHAYHIQEVQYAQSMPPIPSTIERAATLNRIFAYNTLLEQIYQARLATAQRLAPLARLVELMPPSVHLQSVTFNGPQLMSVTFTSRQRDADLSAPTTSTDDQGVIRLTANITLPASVGKP
jgi:hypothetical protein